MSARQPLAPFEHLAHLGKALASAPRLRVLHLLCQCERTVAQLAKCMGLPVGIVSHHLQVLSRVHLVAAQKSGRHVVYRLADETVKAFWLDYREFAEGRLTELQLLAAALTGERTTRGRVDRVQVRRLVADDAAVLLDVRPDREYAAGHLPGALSFPLEELSRRLQDIPPGKVVVLYCRGPYCLLADDAQKILAERGIRALRYEDGVDEWAAAGLPVSRFLQSPID